jgi:uncharacterized protein (DUF433 family)
MAHPGEIVSATEAAAIAELPLRDVHRVIDEEILPAEFVRPAGPRTLLATGLPLIAFYFGTAKRLTADERQGVIVKLAKKLKGARRGEWRLRAWTVTDDYLTIDAGPFVRRAEEGLDRLAAARDLVTSSPDVLGGASVVRGTRIPVYDVAASLAAGLPMERILAAYPSLSAEQAELCRLYARANPPRGRPRRTAPPEGARIVARRKVPRRPAA